MPFLFNFPSIKWRSVRAITFYSSPMQIIPWEYTLFFSFIFIHYEPGMIIITRWKFQNESKTKYEKGERFVYTIKNFSCSQIKNNDNENYDLTYEHILQLFLCFHAMTQIGFFSFFPHQFAMLYFFVCVSDFNMPMYDTYMCIIWRQNALREKTEMRIMTGNRKRERAK